ncbi:MAG: PEP-CTERM sorting domain-containing protein [Pacificimonas sp.]|jgi:hypothetical protein|nr:PEP-CTERM sorting domain-containing protein [Pacificimonas sp.]
MTFSTRSSAALAVAALLAAPAIAAPVNGTGDVSSDVFFGGGNANGDFTGAVIGDVEVAIRGKVRYDASGSPAAIYGYDGDRTYDLSGVTFNAPSNRSGFSFDFIVNTDRSESDNEPVNVIGDYEYELRIDYDPGIGTNFFTLDPFIALCTDASFGYNDTTQSTDAVVDCGSSTAIGDYATVLAVANVAQQSWNLGFFPSTEPGNSGPYAPGIYTIELDVFSTDGQTRSLLGGTSIDIVTSSAEVPAPAAFGLLGLGLAAVGLRRRRR